MVETLSERYNGPLINNTERDVYVEAMIVEILGPNWKLSLEGYSNWSEWDIEYRTLDKKIEIKRPAGSA